MLLFLLACRPWSPSPTALDACTQLVDLIDACGLKRLDTSTTCADEYPFDACATDAWPAK